MENKIYTKKGDKGTTSLGDKTRVRKNHPVVDAVGTLDELNCYIGLAKILDSDPVFIEVTNMLGHIQNDLFNIGSYLSNHEQVHLLDRLSKGIVEMETSIDNMTESMPKLSNFILPGGTELAARFHICRAVSRRAERAISNVANIEVIDERVLQYVNRISDYLFTKARWSNHFAGVSDIKWTKPE